MALLTSEVQRIKAELGYPVLTVQAEPWISVTQIFENVIAPYMTAGAITSSATPVSAAEAPGAAVDLSLASTTGFTAGNLVWVDVDGFIESATVRSVGTSTVNVILSLAHTGTYPVTVDGGEAIVREKLVLIHTLTDRIKKSVSQAGVLRVDEIEFMTPAQMGGVKGVWGQLWLQREAERKELAEILQVPYLRGQRRGGSAVSLY